MQFNLETAKNRKLVNNYGPGYIEIGQQRLESGFFLFESEILPGWMDTDPKALSVESFNPILEKQPSILILGTGAKLIFPEPSVIAGLFKYQIVLETMTTSAACRTYNVLASEGRSVAAALMII